ncbi:hypothetical protein J6590_069955 [Homalodisca vitripennis]|nr:hypothetical protein J6590_069955 [Homalodisca vitripennis]
MTGGCVHIWVTHSTVCLSTVASYPHLNLSYVAFDCCHYVVTMTSGCVHIWVTHSTVCLSTVASYPHLNLSYVAFDCCHHVVTMTSTHSQMFTLPSHCYDRRVRTHLGHPQHSLSEHSGCVHIWVTHSTVCLSTVASYPHLNLSYVAFDCCHHMVTMTSARSQMCTLPPHCYDRRVRTHLGHPQHSLSEHSR